MAEKRRSLLFIDNIGSLNDRLLFAVPKKGRLHQQCLDLLSGSDIQFHRHNRLDIALVQNLPLALIFLPAADIPTFVGEGRVDLGITGRDQVAEHEADTPPTETTGVVEIMKLGFGSCKLQVQVPAKGEIQTPEQLVGKTIVTSFTALSKNYFRNLETNDAKAARQVNGDTENRLRTSIKFVGGSVEAACALGVADGIVDLVGESCSFSENKFEVTLIHYRIWRDHASSRPESNRYSRRIECCVIELQAPIRPKARRPCGESHQGSNNSAEIRSLHLQCTPKSAREGVPCNAWKEGADRERSRRSGLGCCAGNGGEEAHR